MSETVNKYLAHLIYALVLLIIGSHNYAVHKDGASHNDKTDHLHDEIHDLKVRIRNIEARLEYSSN